MKNGIIVRASSEGSEVDLVLYGQRSGRGWLFSRHLVNGTNAILEDPVLIENENEVVSTWAAALELLDRDEFNHLYPLTVHPEFRSKVLKAVLARNRRDGNDWGVAHWHEVCGLPALDDLNITMNFQELQIRKFGMTQGNLLSATPSRSKPSGVNREDWALSLFNRVVNDVSQGGKKPSLAVPRSFWPFSSKELPDYAKSSGLDLIDLMDECEWDSPHDYGSTTPVKSMKRIIDHLQRGEDVLVLSHTRKASDFVPAMLYLVSMEHSEHPAKCWCAMAQDVGVELTQFQRGYLYGLMNANGMLGLEELKRAIHEGRVR